MTKHKIHRQKRISANVRSKAFAGLATILPTLAILRLSKSIDPKILLAYFVTISVITFYLYWSDKKKAKKDAWRTPGSTLHALEFAGGWLAAFIAQRLFRHKTSKTKYQVVFWIIAAIHQYLAFDYLNGWHYTKAGIDIHR